MPATRMYITLRSTKSLRSIHLTTELRLDEFLLEPGRGSSIIGQVGWQRTATSAQLYVMLGPFTSSELRADARARVLDHARYSFYDAVLPSTFAFSCILTAKTLSHSTSRP